MRESQMNELLEALIIYFPNRTGLAQMINIFSFLPFSDQSKNSNRQDSVVETYPANEDTLNRGKI